MKQRFEYYVLGGRGIGLRFVLLICAFFSIIASLSFYVVTQKLYDEAYEQVSQLPPITIIGGKIISPNFNAEKISFPYLTAELNTKIAKIEPAHSNIATDIYLTQTQFFVRDNQTFSFLPEVVQNEMKIVKMLDGSVFRELPIELLSDRIFSIQGYFKKLKSILGLINIGFYVTLFFVLLFDFFVFYGAIIILTPFTRTQLTAAQRGRLLVIPWALLISVLFGFAATGTIVVSWWLGIILNTYSPSMDFGNRISESVFNHFAPMWWISVILFIIYLVIYFIWASGLSIYKERCDEAIKKVKEEKIQK